MKFASNPSFKILLVAPYAGAWIEIPVAKYLLEHYESLPTRERGLKLPVTSPVGQLEVVAPYAGAWIEMLGNSRLFDTTRVAPYAGAWIEISVCP